jgi:hypothetical protein
MEKNEYIPQLENQSKHEQFLQIVKSVDTVIIKIDHARALANKGIDANTYAGEERTVITTTTIMDEKLEDLSWIEELNIVEKFNPDYHIAVDCPTYQEHSKSERMYNLRLYLQGLIFMEQNLRNVQVIPLIKGETKEERNFAKQVYDHYNYGYAVFYVTQYLSVGERHYKVIQKINQIANEFSDKKIIVMGLQAPRYVKKYASNVIAVSGQKWLKVADPNKNSEQQIIENYGNLASNIQEALRDQTQKSLFEYEEASA